MLGVKVKDNILKRKKVLNWKKWRGSSAGIGGSSCWKLGKAPSSSMHFGPLPEICKKVGVDPISRIAYGRDGKNSQSTELSLRSE